MINDKRHNYVIKDFLVPIAAALVIGVGASYSTMRFNEGETQAWRNNVEVQLSSLKVILTAVQGNQLELASRGSWMLNVDKSLDRHGLRLTFIESNRYTREMAAKTEAAILREIDLLRKEVRAMK